MKRIIVLTFACGLYFSAHAQKVGSPCVIMNNKGSVTVGSYENVTVSRERANSSSNNRTNTNSRSTNYSGNANVNGRVGNEKVGSIGASADFGISRNNSNTNSLSNSNTTTNKTTETYTDRKCVDTDKYKTSLW